jgi:excisionase family DNA binding protein
MTTRLHTTVNGHRIEYTPSPKVAAFLDRLADLADDPNVSEQEMIGLAFSRENPILDHTIFPTRGAVTKATLDDPAYAVQADLLFRKRLQVDGMSEEKVAARYTMTVAEAAAELGVHESAIRQAIGAKRLASWVKDGKHFLDPKAVRALELGTRGPRAALVGGPLEIVMGHTADARLKVKAFEPIAPLGRVEGNVVRGRLKTWKRVVVMTVSESGKRAFVLDPGTEDNEITFGPFSVRGRFVVKEKANSAKAAEQVWAAYEVA